jgi:hypothetical protein
LLMAKWLVEMKKGKLWKPYTTVVYPNIRSALTELATIYGRKKRADWRVKPSRKLDELELADVWLVAA